MRMFNQSLNQSIESPLSGRVKVTGKLEELLGLDVIEIVEGPTSQVSPLDVVEKPNGDFRICLYMKQLKRHFKRSLKPKFSQSYR